MEKLTNFLNKYLVPIATKIGSNRYLCSVRDGMVGTMGFTIIGSLCLLIATFPFPQAYVDFMASQPKLTEMLFVPYSLTVGIISVYISFGIGYALTKSYDLNALIGGCSSLFSFLVLSGGLEGKLGAEGMFSAILAAIISVEIYHFCITRHLTIKLPEQVPPAISGSFTAIIPAAITTALLLVLKYVIGFDINNILTTVLAPLFSGAQDSIFMALTYVILATLMWFCGIHPAILITLMPGLSLIGMENTAAFAAGSPIPHIFVNPFYFTFVFIGGQCGTLMLNFIMLRSKSEMHRKLARLALPAGLFNINEPLLFGIPIIFNSTLIVPALIGQILSVLVAWGAFASGLVPLIGLPDAAMWNIPAFIGSALCTLSWKAVVLVLINMTIQGLIYYPFYKIYEKQVIKEELETAEANS